MRRIFIPFLMASCLALSACLSPVTLPYDGPEVTKIVVYKKWRKMALMHDQQILRIFDFELGFAPDGDKFIEGDGKTPEGLYTIDRKNGQSQFHLSLGISYPSAADVAEAKALGEPPGGDIFIHGTPDRYLGLVDWTWGCIAVSNSEIEEIFAMVEVGTPIDIRP